MSAKDILSTALLLFSIVIGPAIFVITIVWYGVTRIFVRIRAYQEQRYLRSLPCGNCQYFANDEFLQCAVNPCQVMTEAAQSCRDFAPKDAGVNANEYCSFLRALLTRKSKLKVPELPSENTQ